MPVLLLTYDNLVAGHLLGPARVALLGRVTLLRVLRVVGLALALRGVLRVLWVLRRGALLLVLRRWASLHENGRVPLTDAVAIRVMMHHFLSGLLFAERLRDMWLLIESSKF